MRHSATSGKRLTSPLSSLSVSVRVSGKTKPGGVEAAATRSLWTASASCDTRIGQLRPVTLSAKQAAKVRDAVAAAAKDDPFTSEVPADALHLRFE